MGVMLPQNEEAGNYQKLQKAWKGCSSRTFRAIAALLMLDFELLATQTVRVILTYIAPF